jgi:hypothetical protein
VKTARVRTIPIWLYYTLSRNQAIIDPHSFVTLPENCISAITNISDSKKLNLPSGMKGRVLLAVDSKIFPLCPLLNRDTYEAYDYVTNTVSADATGQLGAEEALYTVIISKVVLDRVQNLRHNAKTSVQKSTKCKWMVRCLRCPRLVFLNTMLTTKGLSCQFIGTMQIYPK